MHEVLDQIRATLPAGIALRIRDAHAVQVIRGDATEVYQVIMNICANAVRAMPGGGTLEVAVESVTIHLEPIAYRFGSKDADVAIAHELPAADAGPSRRFHLWPHA